jgi:hypothetical protein
MKIGSKGRLRPAQTVAKFHIEQAYVENNEHHQHRILDVGLQQIHFLVALGATISDDLRLDINEAIPPQHVKRGRRVPRKWHEAR